MKKRGKDNKEKGKEILVLLRVKHHLKDKMLNHDIFFIPKMYCIYIESLLYIKRI